MPRTRSQATTAERARYLEAGVEAQAALHVAIRLLKTRQALTADPDESRLILVHLLDLEAEVAKVTADLIAFVAEQRPIEPPTAEDLKQIKAAARELDRFTADAAAAGVILGVATTVLTKWQATRV
jgi:hypothetical protein